MKKVKISLFLGALFMARISLWAASSCAPETWFHIIGGNASKEGLSADIKAISEAGISGIQFFHGGWNGDEPWPGVTNQIPCLSDKWADLVKFAQEECHRRGLSFKMQNCPGWSMSGGPWITPECAMRKLVAFEPGNKPVFDEDDDYREIGEVEFFEEAADESIVRSVTVPAPCLLNYGLCYDIDVVFEVWSKGRKVLERVCPQGTYSDKFRGAKEMTFDIGALPREGLELRVRSPHKVEKFSPLWSSERRLDNWQAKAGATLRSFAMSDDDESIKNPVRRKLVFGHVNMKRKNHPAPPEATGWECDKMDPRGFKANFNGYIGRLLKSGVKVDGLLVDSWECGIQNWTWRMEEEFKKRAGYELRPYLPALFGRVLGSVAKTEKFLLDWRNVCSRLIEENYYAVIAATAKDHSMSVQYETSFGDVLAGDILRYWKYADEPMCEFWSPHENREFVGSFNFKPVLPCVSAAHIYGKRRVSAEALTSFELTFDENFNDWKKIIDKHFARGVTHIVFHTYTHNPIVGGKPPSSSFGKKIGSPFLREQTWWAYMKHFTKYIERCGEELERGKPAVDILMYLGDDVNHKPSERELLFGNRYKYDYLNFDALATRLEVKDGKLVFPDGMSYRVLWIPEGTYLLPATEKRLSELEAKGARIVHGDFKPDWPSPLYAGLGRDASDVAGWYQRRDGDKDIFFVAEKDGRSGFYHIDASGFSFYDPVTGKVVPAGKTALKAPMKKEYIAIGAIRSYSPRDTERIYSGSAEIIKGADKVVLDLGEVKDWATVFIDGRKVADLWCAPYSCDITPFVKAGAVSQIRVKVVSTWYNALVDDAKKPVEERKTWTKFGPDGNARFRKSGLLGPVSLKYGFGR